MRTHTLDAHAHQEADHHLLMQADTHRLVDRWNQNHEPRLNATELLALAPTPGVIGYREMHENVSPFAEPTIMNPP